MKALKDSILENLSTTGLRPTLFFSNIDFFNILTDPDEHKNIFAKYVQSDKCRYVYFYRKGVTLGYLKLSNITPPMI